MTFPKYPEYKDSGVEWLGEVPAHWAIERLKLSTVLCQNGIWGNDAQGDENDVICIRVADFDRTHMRVKLDNPTYRNVTEAEFKSREVIPGDLLLEKSGGGEKQPVGFVALYDDPATAICANFIARIRLAPGMNSSFWRYVHAAGYAIGLNVPSIKQTSGIQNLDQHSYLNERAAYPPSVEQDYIATFLDHETARIDALVEEQQRLIELLKEKRQAVISHAVTKGLDPNVPMKDSGVEWLGEVPANWAVVALRRALQRIEQGWSPECYSFPADEGSWGVLKAGAVNNGVYREDDNKALPEGVEPRHSIEVMPGDLLMCRASGSPELIGSAAYVESTRPMLMISDKLFRLVTNEEVCPEFIALSLGSIPLRRQIEISINGAEGLANNLSQASIKNLKLTLPPISEQRRIVSEIAAVLNSLKEQLDLAVDTVELLQERRSALISAAVTGKIDVRGWQPPAGASSPSEATQTEMV